MRASVTLHLSGTVYPCMHKINEPHPITNLQDLIPTLALVVVLPIIVAAKVGIKSCRLAIECVSFVHA